MGGAHLVVIHYYLHPMFAHLSVTHNRLLMLKAAIERALSRNKNVVFVFRGPHVSSLDTSRFHSIGGNVHGMLLLNIVRGIFKSLQDQVIFIDGWDMSIAMENPVYHPAGMAM